jgi:hypothetical protein
MVKQQEGMSYVFRKAAGCTFSSCGQLDALLEGGRQLHLLCCQQSDMYQLPVCSRDTLPHPADTTLYGVSKQPLPVLCVHTRVLCVHSCCCTCVCTQIIHVNLTSTEPVALKDGASVAFTFAVNWLPTVTPFKSRFERYLDYNFFEHKVSESGE